jgi:hypothetical protein
MSHAHVHPLFRSILDAATAPTPAVQWLASVGPLLDRFAAEDAARRPACDECGAPMEASTEVELDAGRADYTLCRACWREHVWREEACECEISTGRPCRHAPEYGD